ncbi:MAG: PTS sugar transporter subunit IIA [bacterium]|nr:PTS sugar transporter subunit IIA [bacterium]MDT8365262.1 PTS sugar transporter subunit IIA [bacterium]
MKLLDYLAESDVLSRLHASTREGVIKEMVAHLKESGKIDDPEALVSILLDREMLGSTGIGHGVAIPHGRLSGLNEILLVFGRSPEGVDFDSYDGGPVNLIFLLVAPEDSAGLHLKTLARISRLVKSPECRESLLESDDRVTLYHAIEEEDQRH